MSNEYLSWIDDADLFRAVENVYLRLDEAIQKQTIQQLQKRTIDPFTLLFETLFIKDMDATQWITAEAKRQVQKTLGNAIGNFHQQVLGSAYGWTDLGIGHETGLDLRNEDETIFAEIKNKYNTIKGSDKKDYHDRFIDLANSRPDITIYMVYIVNSKGKSFGKDGVEWKIKDKSHPRVRLISGRDFYTLVSQSDTAIEDLYSVLPKVAERVIEINQKIAADNIAALNELDQFSRHNDGSVLTALYSHFFRAAFGQHED